tara:strand:+ start:305 stop:1006 length:702 start_codon:yes stop_codon:yes gene_type:complete
MAVSVDTVYQRVLAIANKEQRGYITPQEFNLFANQAQMDIFEQYFYDLNQFLRIPGNDTEYSDMVNILEEKINIFETSANLDNTYSSFNGGFNTSTVANIYRIGSLDFRGVEMEKIEHKEFNSINRSPLTKPTLDRPIYYMKDISIFVRPSSITEGVNINFIRRPSNVAWGYVVQNGKALYNASRSTNFELHDSEETDLVMKILALAGITMEEQLLYQAASQEDMKNTQQEKQ